MKVRVSPSKVAHVNSWVRQLSQSMDIALVEWDLMLHAGWERNNVLVDDIHPMFAFNYAAGNIYLAMLATEDRAGKAF